MVSDSIFPIFEVPVESTMLLMQRYLELILNITLFGLLCCAEREADQISYKIYRVRLLVSFASLLSFLIP